MRAHAILPILVFPFLLTPAYGDFALLPSQGSTETTLSPDQSVGPTGNEATPFKPKNADRVRPLSKPHLALGFGNKVPLSFAVRQIVPHRTKVRFADAVDRGAFVDWRGGRDWRSVLRTALHPLGLRVIVRDRAVSIVR